MFLALVVGSRIKGLVGGSGETLRKCWVSLREATELREAEKAARHVFIAQ